MPFQTRVRRKEALWASLWVLATAALFFFRHWIIGGFVLLYTLICMKAAWDAHRDQRAIRAAMGKRPRAA